MTAPTAAPATPTTGHPARDAQTARKMSDLVTATDKCRSREDASSDEYYATGDKVYVAIKKTSRFPGGIDKIMKARKVRKAWYQAAAHVEEAARALAVALYEEQQILAASKAKTDAFDATA